MDVATSRPRITPIAPQRVALQVTIRQSTADKLHHAQDLLGFRIQHGDIAEVLDRALDALIVQLENQKFAATGNPRASSRPTSASERYVPSRVKCQVWKRDKGQCTFVSDTGHRCTSRSDLEFDHIVPVARGGKTTASNLRLLCRAHNRYAAECTFGAEFMKTKIDDARKAKAPVADRRVTTNARVWNATDPGGRAPSACAIDPTSRRQRVATPLDNALPATGPTRTRAGRRRDSCLSV